MLLRVSDKVDLAANKHRAQTRFLGLLPNRNDRDVSLLFGRKERKTFFSSTVFIFPSLHSKRRKEEKTVFGENKQWFLGVGGFVSSCPSSPAPGF